MWNQRIQTGALSPIKNSGEIDVLFLFLCLMAIPLLFIQIEKRVRKATEIAANEFLLQMKPGQKPEPPDLYFFRNRPLLPPRLDYQSRAQSGVSPAICLLEAKRTNEDPDQCHR
jgi:hypothetical protein